RLTHFAVAVASPVEDGRRLADAYQYDVTDMGSLQMRGFPWRFQSILGGPRMLRIFHRTQLLHFCTSTSRQCRPMLTRMGLRVDTQPCLSRQPVGDQPDPDLIG